MPNEHSQHLRAVPADPTAVLLERARVSLGHGRLREARAQFLTAAEAAAEAGDPVARAEAAIGAGGLWLYELRVVDERTAFLALCRDALAGLADTRRDLQLRLRARLAAEATYDDTGTLADLHALVDEVRAVGDPTALAESLSLLHHAMLTPRYAHERLAVADELIAVSAVSGDRTLGLMGLLWRTVDLFLLGHTGAERALGDLRLRSEQSDFLVARYVVAAMDTMLLLRAGRLTDAEAAAAECHRLGTEAGDADADGWYLGHLFSIRWIQGRGGELRPVLDQVARGTLLVHAYAAYIWTGAALLAAEAGDLTAARGALDRVLADDLRTLPESSVWLGAMFSVIETAAYLDDADAARDAAALLEPYSSLPVMASLAIQCFGSAARTMGLAHRTCGDLDDAIDTLERAIVENQRLGHLPMLAITRADLADTRLRRSQPGDAARASALLDAAIAGGDALGLDVRVASWRARRDTLVADTAEGHVLQRPGYWEIRAGDDVAVVPDSTGMRYLVTLLEHPAQDLRAADLAGATDDGAAQPVLDDRARRQYQLRIGDLQREIDEADSDADIERAARLRAELDALLEEVERIIRPGGRSRTFVDATERARTSVQKALRRALASIETSAPALADALTESIRTGTTCRFDPVTALPRHWDVRTTNRSAGSP